MTENGSMQTPERDTGSVPTERLKDKVNRTLWVLISVASIAYLLFGSIRIQYWTLNYFTNRFVELRRWEPVRDIWGFQIRNSPTLGSQLLVQVVFSVSLLLIVVGFLYALWLVLTQTSDDETTDIVEGV